MPIEIKELHIRVRVPDTTEQAATGSPSGVFVDNTGALWTPGDTTPDELVLGTDASQAAESGHAKWIEVESTTFDGGAAAAPRRHAAHLQRGADSQGARRRHRAVRRRQRPLDPAGHRCGWSAGYIRLLGGILEGGQIRPARARNSGRKRHLHHQAERDRNAVLSEARGCRRRRQCAGDRARIQPDLFGRVRWHERVFGERGFRSERPASRRS